MAELMKEGTDAAELALLHALALARAVRRIVENALPDDNSDAGADRLSATELLSMIEQKAGEALGHYF
jgi:hypothetical protein